ncbi:uncharacterized protein LOC113274861 isoform X2 [Papaver somniferum]|uniref:uncharacterized protein LOC113274861 isoform X2 n=1 Tax=Papaver somniferum TaxID=3469 RepID=UPI000E6FE4DA|nr:uncharacterized protein LOC113274861 isoform X2 [Papaver somniferum]
MNEQLEWDLLKRDLHHVPVLVEEDDKMEIMENFSTSNCYDKLIGDLDECGFNQFLWKSHIPNKPSELLGLYQARCFNYLNLGPSTCCVVKEDKFGKYCIMQFVGFCGRKVMEGFLEVDISVCKKVLIWSSNW